MNSYTRRHMTLGLRYSSGIGELPPGDMFVSVVSKSAWHDVGKRIASMLIWVNRTCSERGEVKLLSRDPRDEPLVEFNLLSDRRDLERLMDGFKRMGQAYAHPEVQKITTNPFPAAYSDRVRALGVVCTKNKIITGIAGR